MYYYSCACGEKSETTFTVGEALGHTGGTATCTKKAVCTRCSKEYGELKAHVYDQKKETAEYLKAAATCTNKATYFYSCVCGAKGTETFEVGEKLAHTFDKQVADAKYLKSEATCTAKAVYYYSCACGEKGSETFEYGADPAHNYATKWSTSTTEHWHECTKCGDKKDVAAHTPGAAATEYTAQTCTVCSYIITPALGHSHNYSDKWTTNATHHWYECSGCVTPTMRGEHVYDNACDTTCNTCGYTREITHNYGEWKTDSSKHWHECSACGLKADEAAHTWDGGVVTKEATEQAEGVKTFTCTACKATKTEAIAKLPATTTAEPDVTTEAPTTEAPVTEAPVTEAPVTEAPITEAPITEAPVTEAPTTEAPTTEAPKNDGGCGGFVALGMIACIIPAAIVICRKKED